MLSKQVLYEVKNWVVIYAISIFTALFCATLTFGADGNDCGRADRCSDGPPKSSTPLIIKSTQSPVFSALGSSNIVTFRTDTAPELDLYQPCNGGDNLIDFPINVHDVDIASIKSARITMAVWDVDYSCGGSCDGLCERDTVYINGHFLGYLTGADGQWSTVSFDIDPAWLVTGNNQIKIYIDTLSNYCWCVQCDWGELALEVGGTPEIEDIEISSANPETTKDVMFTAKLKNMTGYEVVKIAWAGDVQSGEGNPSYTVKPAAKKHGKDKNITATLTYRKTGTIQTGTHSKSKKFNLFFIKKGDDDGDGTPNWFEYWISDGAVPNMAGVHYDAKLGGWGVSRGNGIFLSPQAGDQHYSSAITLNTHFGTESFGGPTVLGIDCTAEVVAHERYHAWVGDQWWPLGSFFLHTNSDTGVPDADCDDRLPDFYETGTSFTSNNNTDTYDLETIKHPDYRTYGDQEYMAMRTGNGSRGTASNDWANPGKQTNPPYTAPFPAPSPTSMKASMAMMNSTSSGVLATGMFTGTITDSGNDTDGDGLYDLLVISAKVNVTKSGLFGIVVILSDRDSNEITFVNKSFVLEAGVQDIKVIMDGIAIWKHMVNGPFTAVISLYNEEGDPLDQNTHICQAYSYDQFGGVGHITGGYEESTSDDNGNGLFDRLNIEVGVKVIKAGEVVLEGYLHGLDDEPICYMKTTATLPTGDATLLLKAEGLNLRQSRANGPYILKSLALYEDGNRVDFIYNAYQTQSYLWTDFESSNVEFASLNTFTDYGVDTDGDGLFDALRIEVTTNVAQEGQSALVGRLFDADGNSIDDILLQLILPVGSQKINLDFSGIKIRANRKNGPYLLKYAFMYDETGSLDDSLPNAYTTAAYSYKQFKMLPVTLTENYADYGTDTDSDGTYEYLTVEVGAIVKNAGNYAMNARIMDAKGAEIVWASTTAWLAADQPQVLKLNFNGTAIFNNGVNGPYYVRDVYLYNMSNTSLSDSVYDAHTTNPYSYCEFGNCPPVAKAGGPYQGIVGKPVTFDASGSNDPGGKIVLYEWDWNGDRTYDQSTTSPTCEHTWNVEYSGMIYVRVTDNGGLTNTDSASIIVEIPGPKPVDTLVAISTGLISFDRRTGQFSVDVKVKNTSTTEIGEPVWLVINGISNPGVTLASPDGTTVDGKPYINLSSLLGDGKLSPGETVSKRIYFNNPKRLQFTFTPSIRGIPLTGPS
jgi:hypothetical protein